MPLHLIDRPRTGESSRVWDLLDQFLNRLQACADVDRQLVLTLVMVRDAVGADAALLFAGDGAVIARDGPAARDDLAPALARHLPRLVPDGASQLLLPQWPASLPPGPCSAALIRMSQSRGV